MKGFLETELRDAQRHQATLRWLLNWPEMPEVTLRCRPTEDCTAKTRPCILCGREHHHSADQTDGTTRWIAHCIPPAWLWGRELERWWQIVDHGYRLQMIDYDDMVYEPYFDDELLMAT
jgi:hypothetical protein